jgi:hypothetical protein
MIFLISILASFRGYSLLPVFRGGMQIMQQTEAHWNLTIWKCETD